MFSKHSSFVLSSLTTKFTSTFKLIVVSLLTFQSSLAYGGIITVYVQRKKNVIPYFNVKTNACPCCCRETNKKTSIQLTFKWLTKRMLVRLFAGRTHVCCSTIVRRKQDGYRTLRVANRLQTILTWHLRLERQPFVCLTMYSE